MPPTTHPTIDCWRPWACDPSAGLTLTHGFAAALAGAFRWSRFRGARRWPHEPWLITLAPWTGAVPPDLDFRFSPLRFHDESPGQGHRHVAAVVPPVVHAAFERLRAGVWGAFHRLHR